MEKLSLLLLLFVTFVAPAQKSKTFYFETNGHVSTNKNYTLKKVITYKSTSKIYISTYKKTDKKEQLLFAEQIKVVNDKTQKIKIKGKLFSKQITRQFTSVENGLFVFTDSEKGQKIRSGRTSSKVPLIFEGELTEFYANGTKKSVSVYKNNQLLGNKNWTEEGKPYIDNIFYSVDKLPLFKQGMGTLHQHVLKTFRDSHLDLSQISGTIKVGFVVLKNGKIDGVRIEEGISKELDNLALTAFYTLMGEWTPAQLNKQNVNCYQLFPINFILRQYQYDYVELRGGRLYWEIN